MGEFHTLGQYLSSAANVCHAAVSYTPLDVYKRQGMNAATFQQVEMIMKDPKKSGIDVSAPLYVFNTETFPTTVCGNRLFHRFKYIQMLPP